MCFGRLFFTKEGLQMLPSTLSEIFTSLDIQFFEHDLYFPKATTQGESYIEFQPTHSQVFPFTPSDFSPPNHPLLLDSPVSGEIPRLSSTSPSHSSSLPSGSPMSTPVTSQTLPKSPLQPPKPLQVYTRKRRKIPGTILQSGICHELDLSPAAYEETGGNDSTDIPSHLLEFDYVPIGKRKGVRQCTKYPIQRYAAYGKLMPSFKAFTACLDEEHVPKNIEEAL